MANPTTNYGWPMPTTTDLVTDLPADFAAFGQPVDTSLKALNPETTLGDIAYRSSTSNTNTRLGIGTTGQVLTVAAGVPSWASPAGSKVVQIVAATTTTNVRSTTNVFVDTTLTATITPTSASNKILVFVNQNGIDKDGNTYLHIRLLRDSTSIAAFAKSILYTATTAVNRGGTASVTILDSPATTSATTYKTQFKNEAASGTADVQITTDVSSIVLMEVTP